MGIFEPFRAIGYITSGVPFSVQRLGTETFVTVSVGKAFQVYICAKLTLVLACPQLPHTIRTLASYREFTFVAFGTHIAVFKRAHQVARWSGILGRGGRGYCADGQPLLASGGSSGVISIWNLEKRKLQSVVREAHDSSIVSLHFLANEPVLMSSSADNSIEMWVFDTTDGDPRILHFRSGHSAPPLCMRFYANGRHILSAGQDRAFRLFSVIQDQQRGRTEIEACHLPLTVERDWCNVVTCHMDTAQAYVWRLQNFVIGEHILRPCPEKPTPVKACTISACGNFAILGTAGGWL
ncbi:hypothetical protein NC651_036448 [Populus alba x Populus x berolinensis]|nr:hypothetical protein NC651_036448 [Populus alba x Populus x berolinensis]